MKTELTKSIIDQAQSFYDKVGNIKKVAKKLHISYSTLRNVIKSETITPKKRDTSSYRKEVKRRLIEYKGGKCLICGYNKCQDALEFHHLDPSQKDYNISGGTKSFDTLKSEVDKCILVCANCHREIHHSDLNMDNISNIINTTNKKKTFSNKEYGSICPQCGKRFPKMKGKIFCSSECRNLFKHYPTKELLEEQYNILHSWDKVAKYFNITRRITLRIRK